MTNWKKVCAEDVMEFRKTGSTYASKILTCEELVGEKVININHGVLDSYARTTGAAHKDMEIYYIVSAGSHSYVVLDNDRVPVKNGDIIVIPGGVFHWIDNLDNDSPFVLLTFWPDEKQNSMFLQRLSDWGCSMRYLQQGE